MNPQGDQPDYSKPVAYDEHGRPLYALSPEIIEQVQSQALSSQAQSPPQEQTQTQNQALAQSNSTQTGQSQSQVPSELTSPQRVVNPDISRLHQQSNEKYPSLNLSDDEYVISTLRRHPIGIITIWAIVALSILITLFLPAIYYGLGVDSTLRISATAMVALGLVLLAIIVLVIVAGMIATYVYESNGFFLTNENVTQRIQASLFSKKIQTISLGSIEDVSYRRSGIIQTLLNYGSIRLSTEGEETTYRFNYAFDPESQVHIINDAMEEFRRSHPQNNNGS